MDKNKGNTDDSAKTYASPTTGRTSFGGEVVHNMCYFFKKLDHWCVINEDKDRRVCT